MIDWSKAELVDIRGVPIGIGIDLGDCHEMLLNTVLDGPDGRIGLDEFPKLFEIVGFTVRAVQSHDALLDACQAALSLNEGTHTGITPERVNDMLREAIAKATGEK